MRAPAAPLSTASIVPRYYGVWLVYALAGGFLAGVYPLFLRSRGLNQFEIKGAHEPLALSWFNEQLQPEERATMLSFRVTMATAGGAVGLLLGGFVADLRGIPFAWKMAGALSLLAVPCYLALRPRPDLEAARRTAP